MPDSIVQINRAPVFTLWGAVVAKHLGFQWEEALSLGKVMAGLTAQKKGRTLGIFSPGRPGPDPGSGKAGLGEEFWVELCGRPIPAKHTSEGIRAVVKDKPVEAEKVTTYLVSKFGPDLQSVQEAMEDLAGSFDPEDLKQAAYGLYEQFRPKIPSGRRGWGAKGDLNLDVIRSLA